MSNNYSAGRTRLMILLQICVTHRNSPDIAIVNMSSNINTVKPVLTINSHVLKAGGIDLLGNNFKKVLFPHIHF